MTDLLTNHVGISTQYCPSAPELCMNVISDSYEVPHQTKNLTKLILVYCTMQFAQCTLCTQFYCYTVQLTMITNFSLLYTRFGLDGTGGIRDISL